MNTKLLELAEKVKRKEKLDNILDDLMIQKDEMQGQIYDLQAELADEEADVVRLEGFSLQGMWLSLLGKKEEELGAEQQQVKWAQMKLAAADNEMSILKREIAKYEKEMASLGDCEQEYRQELENRINSISSAEDLSEDDKVVIVERLGEIAAREKEINEAVKAGDQSLKIIADIHTDLESAKGWSVADILTDSMIMTLIKRDKMNKAQDSIYRLQHSLKRFKTELCDVEIEADIELVADNFLDIADFWLDGLFVDMAVHSKIDRARISVAKTADRIQAILRKLYEHNNELSAEKQKLNRLLKRT